MSILELVLAAIAFAIGLGLIPIIAMVGKGALPAMLAEPLAGVLFSVMGLGTGPMTLNQTETGEYELTPADTDLEPKSYWTRWAMVKFGVSFDATEESFGTLPRDLDPDGFVDEEIGPFPSAAANFERGGVPWYIDLRELRQRADDIWLPVGEKLSNLRGAAGIDMATDSVSEALKEHGGDTSTMDTKYHVVGFSLFTAVGLAIGFWVFLL